MSSSSPLRIRESGPEKDSLQAAVVWVRRDFCDNVTDKEEFVGRFNAVSRLPQYLIAHTCQLCTHQSLRRLEKSVEREGHVSWRTYLITAMFTGAVVLAR